MSTIIELFKFLLARKKIWLFPVIIILIVFGMLIVFSQGSVFAPFIYYFLMKIIGISSYYHDSAAALVDNHEIISAAQERDLPELSMMPTFY